MIQARLNSTRLPGKAIKEINGLPLIVHIYRRLLACRELDGVIVAAAFENRTEIYDVCNKYRLTRKSNAAHIAPPEDLIGRFLDIQTVDYFDAFVRITADCLFHDSTRIDAMVADYRKYYPKYRGLSNRIPYRTVSEGLDAEIYGTELLAELDRNPKCPREDFAVYAEENGYLGSWPLLEQQRYPIGQDLHLSIDTQQDFDRAEKMLKILGNDEWRYEKTLEAYGKVMAEE